METEPETEPEMETEPETEPEPFIEPLYKDFDGKEFVIWAASVDNNLISTILTGDETGDTLSQAVYQQNKAVTEKFNCTITELAPEKLFTDLMFGVMSDTFTCDFAMLLGSNIISSYSYYFSSWTECEGITMEEVWWDASALETYHIYDKQYSISGAFNMNNFATRLCFVYNRELVGDNVESIIHSVNNGEWMAVDGDINVGAYRYYRAMMAGYEYPYLIVNEDGEFAVPEEMRDIPNASLVGVYTDEFLDKVRGMYSSSASAQREKGKSNLKDKIVDEDFDYENFATYVRDFNSVEDSLFKNGQAAYTIARLDQLPSLMETGLNIGVLPLPGGNNNSLVENALLACVPCTISDTTDSLILLNALSCYYYQNILPVLTTQLFGEASDAASDTNTFNRNMIQYIYDNPYYNLEVGGISEQIQFFYSKYVLHYDSRDIWDEGYLTPTEVTKKARTVSHNLWLLNHDFQDILRNVLGRSH